MTLPSTAIHRAAEQNGTAITRQPGSCSRPRIAPLEVRVAGRMAGLAAGVRVAGVLLAIITLLACGLSGCGLTGGSIPSGGGPPPPTRSFQAAGRVQLAAAPYSSLTGSTVAVRYNDGSFAAGPVPVSGSGDFAFTNLPASTSLTLLVSPPPGSSLASVSIPFESDGSAPVQFVVAEPPLSYQPPTSIRLETDMLAPVIDQTAQIQAIILGGTPGLAPSWISFGTVGVLSAIGPVAQFVPQTTGSATVYAYAGGASAAISLTVPVVPVTTTGTTTGVINPGGPPPPPTLPGETGGRTGSGFAGTTSSGNSSPALSSS